MTVLINICENRFAEKINLRDVRAFEMAAAIFCYGAAAQKGKRGAAQKLKKSRRAWRGQPETPRGRTQTSEIQSLGQFVNFIAINYSL